VPSSLNPAEGSDGALYGTTFYGGSSNVGTVFKLNPDGSAYRVLHSFAGGGEGGNPSGVIEGSDGTLYGTAGSVVFRLNKDGNGYGIVADVPQPAQNCWKAAMAHFMAQRGPVALTATERRSS